MGHTVELLETMAEVSCSACSCGLVEVIMYMLAAAGIKLTQGGINFCILGRRFTTVSQLLSSVACINCVINILLASI